MVDWTDIPSELLSVIMKNLNKLDVIRCGSVSKWWFSVQQEHASVLKLPWLILGDDHPNTGSRGIYSLEEQKTDRLVLPELIGKRCCGSSHGWIFTIDGEMKLSLLHPLTASRINLPCLPFYDEENENPNSPEDLEILQLVYVKKGILSCDPIKNLEECVVMVIFGSNWKLAYCKIQDNSWTILPRVSAVYTDVILYKEMFHAVDARGNTVVVSDTRPTRSVTIYAPRVDTDMSNDHYLVEFNGDLLHVERHISSYEDVWYMGYDNEVMYKRCSFFKDRDLEKRPDRSPLDSDDSSDEEEHEFRAFTYGFDVFKLDTVANEWIRVESLGDHALLLGINHSKCILTTEYKGFRANCIYFTDNYFDRLPQEGYEDNGIYDLETKKIESVYSVDFFHPLLSPPMWFLAH